MSSHSDLEIDKKGSARGAASKRASAVTKKGKATRERIFAASINLITEKGYEAATIPDICLEAGVSVGNFYHHFRSKSDILLAYVREEDEGLITCYRELEGRSRNDALLSCIERFFGYYARKGRNFVATFLSILLTEGGAWFHPEELAIHAIIHDCLERGVRTGEFLGGADGEDLEELVLLANGLVWDLSCTWCVNGGSEGLAAEAQRRFDLLLGLFRAREGNAAELR